MRNRASTGIGALDLSDAIVGASLLASAGCRRVLTVTVILAALFECAFAYGWGNPTEGRPLLQVFMPSDYQASATVNTVAQDHDGVLYFGSDVLLQYDGTTWRRFSTKNNLAINSLAINEQGRIWVGGYSEIGYFEKDSSGQLHYTSLLSKLPPEHRDRLFIYGVEVTSRGVVFSALTKSCGGTARPSMSGRSVTPTEA